MQSDIFSQSSIHTSSKHVMTFQINTLRLDSTHPDTYNPVGFSECLHLWWIPLLTQSCSPPSYVLQVLQWIKFPLHKV